MQDKGPVQGEKVARQTQQLGGENRKKKEGKPTKEDNGKLTQKSREKRNPCQKGKELMGA